MIPADYEWIRQEAEPKWTLGLLNAYGLEFAPGHPNPVISEWEKETGATLKGYFPFCGLTMAKMMKDAGVKAPAVFLRALSWASWGEAIQEPEFGDVLVFTWTHGSDRGGSHVTSYVGEDEEGFVHCLGGNQGHFVDIARFPKNELHAARRPTGAEAHGVRLLNPDGSKREAA